MNNPNLSKNLHRYFQFDNAVEQPTITREGNILTIPVFIEEEEREDVGTSFSFVPAKVPFRGQDISNYDKCVLQSWSDLRRFFYGSTEMQNELKDDHAWEEYRQTIRSEFPKYAGEINLAEARFNAIKQEFKDAVTAACAKINVDKSTLPASFPAEYMLELAESKGMSKADIDEYTKIFSMISMNLLHNDRNWAELFS